jgi:hypothetical protein
MARRLAPRAIVAGFHAGLAETAGEPGCALLVSGAASSSRAQELEKAISDFRATFPHPRRLLLRSHRRLRRARTSPLDRVRGRGESRLLSRPRSRKAALRQRSWTPSTTPRSIADWLPGVATSVPPVARAAGCESTRSAPGRHRGVRQRDPDRAPSRWTRSDMAYSVPSRLGQAFDDAVASMLRARGPFWSHAGEDGARTLQRAGLPLEVTWPEGAREAVVFVFGRRRLVGPRPDGRIGAWRARHRGRRMENACVTSGAPRAPERFRADLAAAGRLDPGWRDRSSPAATPSEPRSVRPRWPCRRTRRPARCRRIAGLVLLEPGPLRHVRGQPARLDQEGRRSDGPPVRRRSLALARSPSPLPRGRSDRDSGCTRPGPPVLWREELPGGHHFGGAFKESSRADRRVPLEAGNGWDSRAHGIALGSRRVRIAPAAYPEPGSGRFCFTPTVHT